MIFKNKKRSKIFCIGLHKTGTTSIEKVLTNLNYKIGDQVQGELLLDNWYRRDFDSIIEFSKSAEAFQDTPFSLPFTFIALDQYFENAKFILSVRDDPEQWYNSLTKFHSKKWGFGQNPPTLDQLKEANYRYKGYAYDFNRKVFSTPQNQPYHKKELINYYIKHNKTVKDYFRSQPDKCIEINVNNNQDFSRLVKFLGKTTEAERFPWENKTSEL